jgi:hypothetical protein
VCRINDQILFLNFKEFPVKGEKKGGEKVAKKFKGGQKVFT